MLAVALTASTSFAGHNGHCPPGYAQPGHIQTSKGPRLSTNLTVLEARRYYTSSYDDRYSRRSWDRDDRYWDQNREYNRRDRDAQSSKENRNNDRS
jgi:hypothetical protein